MIYQIYYDEAQKKTLDFEPLHNPECTYYFENVPIIQAVNHDFLNGEKYTGVLSPNYLQKAKMLGRSNIKNIINTTTKTLSKELILNSLKSGYDVIDIMRHVPHDVVFFSDKFHPNFSRYISYILNEIGHKLRPQVYGYVTYCNYQICRTDVYKAYIDTLLIPAMKVMDTMPELNQNSKYPKKLPIHLQKAWGIDFYTYHTFICERLFTIFINQPQYNSLKKGHI